MGIWDNVKSNADNIAKQLYYEHEYRKNTGNSLTHNTVNALSNPFGMNTALGVGTNQPDTNPINTSLSDVQQNTFPTNTTNTQNNAQTTTPTNTYVPNNTDVGTNNPSLSAEDQALYDYTMGGLNRSLTEANTNQAMDIGTLESQQNTLGQDVSKSKKTAEQQVADEISKAAKTSKDTQKSIRNILRALGVLGSSYAAEQLGKPANAFDENKATLAKWGMDRMAELDDYLTKKTQEIESAKTNVIKQYNQIRQKIQDDIRYTDQQKFVALQAAKKSAQDTINSVAATKAANEEKARAIIANVGQQLSTYLNAPGGFANLPQLYNSLTQLQGVTTPKYSQVATQEKKYDIYGNLIQ